MGVRDRVFSPNDFLTPHPLRPAHRLRFSLRPIAARRPLSYWFGGNGIAEVATGPADFSYRMISPARYLLPRQRFAKLRGKFRSDCGTFVVDGEGLEYASGQD